MKKAIAFAAVLAGGILAVSVSGCTVRSPAGPTNYFNMGDGTIDVDTTGDSTGDTTTNTPVGAGS